MRLDPAISLAFAALWLASCGGPGNARVQSTRGPADTTFVCQYLWDDGSPATVSAYPVTLDGHDYLYVGRTGGLAHRGGCRACARLRCPCDSGQVDANAAYLRKQRMGTTRVVGVYGAELNAAPTP